MVFFRWITRKVEETIGQGFLNAAQKLDSEPLTEISDAPLADQSRGLLFRQSSQPAIAASQDDDEEPGKKKRKS